jgi:hypothetical protein
MKLNKCKFCQIKLVHLGHVLDKDGIRPNPAKVEAITKIKIPQNIKELRRFLGITGYYRKFIKNYARIANPLTNLTKKNTLYKWSNECQDAFAYLKQRLCEDPILHHPDFSKTFKLFTDASTTGLGAVLSQDIDDREYVIAYASRTLVPAEKNYGITELECLAIVWAIGHFRPYLYGTKFIVITDHHALKWLMSMKMPTGRLARWAIKLQQYDMEIQYRPGRIHSNVDTLSRTTSKEELEKQIEELETRIVQNVSVLDCEILAKPIRKIPFLPDQLYDQWKIAQQQDFNTIIQNIGDPKISQDYILLKEILYKYKEEGMADREDNVQYRLVVPQKFRTDILKEYHDFKLSGHLGVRRTYEQISRKYYWKGMYNDISIYVRNCLECHARKGDPSELMGRYRPPIVTKPWELVATDFVGPFGITKGGNKYILLFVDYFTRYIEIIPTESNDSKAVATSLISMIITRFGAPEKLMSDCGSHFVSQAIEQTLNILGIKHIKTSPYHHQSNGMVERLAKTIEIMLSLYVNDHQDDWDQYLPFVAFAYNTSIHSSTGRTPYELIYGQLPSLPSDIVEYIQEPKEIEAYHHRIINQFKKIRMEVKEHDIRAKEQYWKTINKNQKAHSYKEGDMVWLYAKSRVKGKNPKLMKRWHGPFYIVRFNSQDMVILKSQDNRLLKNAIHISRLKKYLSKIVPEESIKLDDDDLELQEEYEVEKILDIRINRGKRQYKVKWKGYGENENTWEPIENLEHCKEMIEKYHDENNLKCAKCDYISITERGSRDHKRRCADVNARQQSEDE